ncbi:MAG: hypothetical protein WCK31_02745 [bacterium]
MQNRKLKVGWFSFTCCEDSLILFTEILNTKFFDWKQKIEFSHFRILKTKNDMHNLDIAFVEGAISSSKQADELLKVRINSTKLVAIGSCAVTGQPSNKRNEFPEEILNKYKDTFEKFKYSDKVKKVSDVVNVDDSLSGCPMNEAEFITKFEGYIKEFNNQNA